MSTLTVRHTTTVSVVLVAGIAALVSYSHMAQLADRPGEAWRAWLIPLSIDGLVAAASMVLLTRRRASLPGGHLAWGALAAGVLVSLPANMADARPGPVGTRLVSQAGRRHHQRDEEHNPDLHQATQAAQSIDSRGSKPVARTPGQQPQRRPPRLARPHRLHARHRCPGRRGPGRVMG